jgi:hypothetical protein
MGLASSVNHNCSGNRAAKSITVQIFPARTPGGTSFSASSLRNRASNVEPSTAKMREKVF